MIQSITRLSASLVILISVFVGTSKLIGAADRFSLTIVGQGENVVFVDPFRCNRFRLSTGDSFAALSVRMSPDGQRLALIGREPNTDLGVYIANWDGSDIRRTGYFDVYEYTLAWTQDSRYLSYVGMWNEFNAAYAIDTHTNTREMIFSEAEEIFTDSSGRIMGASRQ